MPAGDGVSRQVTVVEVGPRDGLQSETRPLDVDGKRQLIRRLAAAGLPVVEAGAMVSPRAVPQMANTEAVLAGLELSTPTRYPVLVPNGKGLQRALAAGVREVAVFAAASDAFSRHNIGVDVHGSLERYRPVVRQALDAGCRVRGYVSCVMGCPLEGEVEPARVLEVSRAMLDMGCGEISLGDTVGCGTPEKTRRLLDLLLDEVAVERLAVHFHDTWGLALVNLHVALEMGVRIVDSSVAGLGGCPYAPGASGNVATEDVLHLCHAMGLETGVDLQAVAETGRWVCEQLQRPYGSRVGQALRARCDPETGRA